MHWSQFLLVCKQEIDLDLEIEVSVKARRMEHLGQVGYLLGKRSGKLHLKKRLARIMCTYSINGES